MTSDSDWGWRKMKIVSGIVLLGLAASFIFISVLNQKITVFALVEVDSAQISVIRESNIVKEVQYQKGTESIGTVFIEMRVKYYEDAVKYIDTIPHADVMIWQEK